MYLVEGGANSGNRKKVWFWLFILFRVSTVAKFIVPDWGVKVDPMLSSQGLWIYWLLVDSILHISWFVPVQDYGILLASGTMPNVLNPVELNFSGLGAIRDYNRWSLYVIWWTTIVHCSFKRQFHETTWDFLPWMEGPRYKVSKYKEYHNVCPLVGIGTPPPLSRKLVCPTAPPPRNQGRGAHSPAGEGWGSPNSDDWRKNLALCQLCGPSLNIGVAAISLNRLIQAEVMPNRLFVLTASFYHSLFVTCGL